MEKVNIHGKYDVLMVDDNLEICDVMKFYLRRIDTIRSILTVHDGMSATQKLRNQSFDLILLDMKLPRKNGYEVLEEFRENQFNSISKVLAISGTLSTDILTIAAYHGVRSFLVKPFNEALFRGKIGGILTLEEEKNVS
ncbi:response regulator [Bacteriovorax sp. PP10]|uniref:Response regulator n=1 Tax=Bacteriovorax antarcticus TaxID=3088717 RepID=A0ABU5VTR4_9BACT|nr:response regulator [Bacteriovorax sp. PP10]MEA9356437.1 response regulator [Bacteriovorax sp. PP10]